VESGAGEIARNVDFDNLRLTRSQRRRSTAPPAVAVGSGLNDETDCASRYFAWFANGCQIGSGNRLDSAQTPLMAVCDPVRKMRRIRF
jgi:hypothetical protein